MRPLIALLLALSQGVPAAQVQRTATDARVKQEIIRASIASYAGTCPCPYSTDRAGRRCGRRSAYSRPGGASPLCYEADVSQKMVDEYRKTEQRRPPPAKTSTAAKE